LKRFYPGALVWFEGKFHRVADPWRHPVDAITALGSPTGSFADKLRIGGICRERGLETSSRMFELVFRMFRGRYGTSGQGHRGDRAAVGLGHYHEPEYQSFRH